MAYAAIQEHLPFQAWFLFVAALIWPIIYDTPYAMADAKDDQKLGVYSTALWWGDSAAKVVAYLQALFLLLLALFGYCYHLKVWFYVSLLVTGGFFIHQQYGLCQKTPKAYMQVFIRITGWAW